MSISDEDRATAQLVIPAGYSESEFELSEEEIALNAFRDEARENENYSKIVVSRVPMNERRQRGGSKLAFLFECGIDEYSYSQLCGKIRDEYGSGYYKLQARNDRGQLKLNKTIIVEAPKNHKPEVSGHNDSAVIDAVSQALEVQRRGFEELISRTAPNAPMQNLFSPESITAIASLITSLGLGNRPQAPTAIDKLAEAATVKSLLKDLAGDSGEAGEANIYSLLGDTAKSLGGPLAELVVRGAEANPSAPTPAPAALPPANAETPAQPEMTEEQMRQLIMRQQIENLVKNAQAEVPPETMATIVLNQTPEAQEDALFDFINKESAVDDMAALVPEVNSHRDWFEALRKALYEAMTEEIDDGLPDGGEGGTVAGAVAGASEQDTSARANPSDTRSDT